MSTNPRFLTYDFFRGSFISSYSSAPSRSHFRRESSTPHQHSQLVAWFSLYVGGGCVVLRMLRCYQALKGLRELLKNLF